MFYVRSMDIEQPPGHPEPAEWSAEDAAKFDEYVQQAASDAPDTVDRVVELADMMTTFAAQRFVFIDTFRREALAEAAQYDRRVTEIAGRSLRLELAAALRVTEYAADRLLQMAEALVHRYPTVLDSLSRAAMSERHADMLVEALDAAEPDLRDDLLPRAVALAEAQAVGTFRRSLRKLVDTARAATLATRYADAVEKRRSCVDPVDDGMAWLQLYVPDVEARAIHSRATAIAKVLAANPEETRTLDQLRADVMCDLLLEGGASVHPPEARGIQATVAVTVPALALLGGEHAVGSEPPIVEGLGPIPIDRARELCGGAAGWTRILTHPETGMVLSVGRDHYRPPASLRRLVRWRADRCMAPGCGMPASRCQIDHNIAWEEGGTTSLGNLGPFCLGHHIVKHHGRWQVTQIPGSGGAIEWISPTGRRYVVEPERRVPVFRPSPEPPPF